MGMIDIQLPDDEDDLRGVYMRKMHLPEGSRKMEDFIRMKLIGLLREVIGSESLEIRVEGELGLLQVLNMLPERLKREVLRGDKEPSPKILILVNGVEVTSFGDLERVRVRAGDEIVLIPIIHGG
ncbi:MAG TPA: hypothetical protein ENF33_04250 [Nitrososphaeria archaeon]|nr:hypothetical protein [Nitrososphaeria archaeon]